MDLGVVSGRYITLDTCPVPIQFKESNLKTWVRGRFSKMHLPNADPEAGPAAMVKYLRPFKKKPTYSWGMRTTFYPMVSQSFLPLSQPSLLIPLIQELKEQVELHPQAVVADAAYDRESNLKFMVYQLKEKPIIARNLRWEKHRDHILSRKGTPPFVSRV